MGQSATPQWWEIALGILSIPTAIIGLFYSYTLIQKTLLETKKTKLEILEKENKLRGRKNPSNQSLETQKSNSFFDKIVVFLRANSHSEDITGTLHNFGGIAIEFIFLCSFLYATAVIFSINYIFEFSPTLNSLVSQDPIIAIIINYAVVTIYLGILLSDILGFTNILGREKMSDFGKRGFLLIVLSTTFLQIIFGLMIAASRFNFLFSSAEAISTLNTISLAGKNLLAIPLLLSTVFAFRGINAIATTLILIIFSVTKLLASLLGAFSGDK